MGRLRKRLRDVMVDFGYQKAPMPGSYEFLWVKRFPLFSPSTDQSEPGQSARTGFKSSHHPFTAPTPADMFRLQTDPWRVTGEHYDLVVNGVELGGGSTRIHNADLQRTILKDILKVEALNMTMKNRH